MPSEGKASHPVQPRAVLCGGSWSLSQASQCPPGGMDGLSLVHHCLGAARRGVRVGQRRAVARVGGVDREWRPLVPVSRETGKDTRCPPSGPLRPLQCPRHFVRTDSNSPGHCAPPLTLFSAFRRLSHFVLTVQLPWQERFDPHLSNRKLWSREAQRCPQSPRVVGGAGPQPVAALLPCSSSWQERKWPCTKHNTVLVTCPVLNWGLSPADVIVITGDKPLCL